MSVRASGTGGSRRAHLVRLETVGNLCLAGEVAVLSLLVRARALVVDAVEPDPAASDRQDVPVRAARVSQPSRCRAITVVRRGQLVDLDLNVRLLHSGQLNLYHHVALAGGPAG